MFLTLGVQLRNIFGRCYRCKAPQANGIKRSFLVYAVTNTMVSASSPSAVMRDRLGVNLGFSDINSVDISESGMLAEFGRDPNVWTTGRIVWRRSGNGG